MTRIGILGGTFDPPHAGHVEMALTAAETLGCSKVFLIPAYDPPHKDGSAVSPFRDRLEMARLAAKPHDKLEVSSIEQVRGGRSFTVDLLREFGKLHKGDLYFILGADSLTDFPSWKNPEGILELATIVVFPRQGRVPRLEVPGEASVVVIEKSVTDVSSHAIRDMYRSGRPVGSLVPDEVNAYILDNSLYNT